MKIVIIGYGKMGRVLEQTAQNNAIEVAAIVGKTPEDDVYAELSAIDKTFDCLIDFSHHNNIEKVLSFAEENRKPLVIAVTGLNETQQKQLQATAMHIPVVYSQNMSIGINVLKNLAAYLSKTLGDSFDIELIEKHHNLKEDAPSGTATMLLTAIHNAASANIVHGRKGMQKRTKGEIGVHALRGGTIVGEHSVIFAGNDEVIEIKHTALSKRIFADGALRAAQFVIRQTAGLYGMEDVLKEK